MDAAQLQKHEEAIAYWKGVAKGDLSDAQQTTQQQQTRQEETQNDVTLRRAWRGMR